MKSDVVIPTPKSLAPTWWRLLLGLLIAGGVVYYFAQNVSVRDVWAALRSAEIFPIFLTMLVIVATGFAKAFRWRLIFSPAETRPPLFISYAAVMLGQMGNRISPIPRLGDLMRLYHVYDSADTDIGQAFGTLVTEKSLELLLMLLTVALVLPLLAVEVINPLPTLIATVLAVLIVMYLVAYQTALVLKIAEASVKWLPEAISSRLLRIVRATLRGVSALRDPRLTANLLLLSGFISLLYILPAYLLGQAFGFELTLIDAALINFAAFFGILLPVGVTLGVQELLISAVLAQLGINDPAAALSYALIYRVSVVTPPLLIGGIAAFTVRWHWRDAWQVAARR